MRIGIGYDLHQTAAGRPLILGGVEIPGPVGLLGHSDADVVLHALCDALLGTIGGPDIGALFPDSDPQWRGAASTQFVEAARERVYAAGWRVANADVIIHAQQPKLAPYRDVIGANVARVLGVEIGRVAIKATTNEGLDAVGRGEAIASWAAVLVESGRPT
jgi:2-C-methyl-D-erythritol 2,4-cyclodiphosphate synthase